MQVTGTYRTAWSVPQEQLLPAILSELSKSNANGVHYLQDKVAFQEASLHDFTGLSFQISFGTFAVKSDAGSTELSFQVGTTPGTSMIAAQVIGSFGVLAITVPNGTWYLGLLAVAILLAVNRFAVRASAGQWLEAVCSRAEQSARAKVQDVAY
jgi:hypothetical protein